MWPIFCEAWRDPQIHFLFRCRWTPSFKFARGNYLLVTGTIYRICSVVGWVTSYCGNCGWGSLQLFCTGYSKAWSHHACQANLLTSGLAHVMLASQEILHNMAAIQELRCQMAATQESLCKMAAVQESHVTSQLIFQSLFQWQLIFQSLVTSQLIVQSLTARLPPCLSLIAKWPPCLSLIARWLLCLILWPIWSWFCCTVCLMVAARRVHGSGGRSLWWSSVLSSHIAGCRCCGARWSSPPTKYWAIWTLLCRAFRLRAVQFP